MFQRVSNVRYRKIFMHKNVISRFPVENFLSRCRKISLGNTSVYQKSSAIEKFHD